MTFSSTTVLPTNAFKWKWSTANLFHVLEQLCTISSKFHENRATINVNNVIVRHILIECFGHNQSFLFVKWYFLIVYARPLYILGIKLTNTRSRFSRRTSFSRFYIPAGTPLLWMRTIFGSRLRLTFHQESWNTTLERCLQESMT